MRPHRKANERKKRKMKNICYYLVQFTKKKRKSLFECLYKDFKIPIVKMSTENIFLLVLNPSSNNVELQKIIAKHAKDCYQIRHKNVVNMTLSTCKFIWNNVDVQCIRHQIKLLCMHECMLAVSLRGLNQSS